MSNFILSCLICAALFIAPIAAAIIPHPEYFERENRRLWPFPDWPKTWEQKQFLRYFKALDRFFPDRFPLRERLLGISKTPFQLLGESTDFDQAYRGKKDFIFLGNSYDASLDKLEGLKVFPPEKLRRDVDRFLTLDKAFRAVGADFVIFIGPDKEIVYRDCLPDIIRPARTRYIQPLVDALRAAGLKVYDPTERLLRKKSEKLLYYKTDTHWNIYGAFEAFRGFCEYMGFPSLQSSFQKTLPGIRREGDMIILGEFKNYPVTDEVADCFFRYGTPPPPVWEPPLKPLHLDTKVFIFGDSFTFALLPFFDAVFTDVTWESRHEFEKRMEKALEKKPDLAIWINVERQL